MKPTWIDIERRIASGEDERTEFKLWSAFPDKVAIALCAFANSEGGLLILGVDDSGRLVGVPGDPGQVQERLSSLLQTGLNAPLGAYLGKHTQDGVTLHYVEVRRTRGPEPLRYRGKVHVRRGRASVEPSPSELQDLYNTFGFVLTEEQLVPGSSIDEVDVESFRRFLERQGIELAEEPQPDLTADLRNRWVVGDAEGEIRLTVYGALAFAKRSQAYLPLQNAWVDCVAYAGADRADEVILRGEAKGRADEQVERAVGWLKSLGIRETYEGIHRKDVAAVPERAFREIVVNAVAHRDYAVVGSKVLVEVFTDRVEVTSPGVLPNHMTAAAAMSGGVPRSRNALLAHFLFVSRLMEQRGRGFPIVRREMKQFNGTDPVLVNDVDGRFVRVTMWR